VQKYIDPRLIVIQNLGETLEKYFFKEKGRNSYLNLRFYPGSNEMECVPVLEKILMANLIIRVCMFQHYAGYSPERINQETKKHIREKLC